MEVECKNEVLKIYENGIKIGNELWVSKCPGNGLYKIDLKNRNIGFVERFSEKQNKKLFSDIVFDGDTCLFFVPLMAEKLAIYDMEKNDIYSVECKESREIQYALGILDGGYLYLFPRRVGGIAKISVRDYKVEYMYGLMSYLRTHFTCNFQFFYAYYLYEGKVYLPLMESSILVEYDYAKDKYEIYPIDGIDNIGFYNCMGIGQEVYMLDRYGTVYCFDIETKVTNRIFSMKSGALLPYSFVIVYFNEIWLIPYSEDRIVIYNLIKKKSCFLNIIPDESNEKRYKKVFYEKGKIWLYPNLTRSIVEIDMKTRKMQGYFLPYENTLAEYIKKLPLEEKMERIENNGEKIYKALQNT